MTRTQCGRTVYIHFVTTSHLMETGRVTSHPQKEPLLYVKNNMQKYIFVRAGNFKTKVLHENRSKAHHDLWKVRSLCFGSDACLLPEATAFF